jgi:hypothetical protein
LTARIAPMSNIADAPNRWLSVPDGIKQKDLVGIPWRVAFASSKRRLVSPLRHHLEQTEPDAGKRDRPADESA